MSRRLRLTLLLTALFLAVVVPAVQAMAPFAGTARKALWQEVTNAEGKGLPKTALKALERILVSARQSGDWCDLARALVRKIVLESNIEGNKPEEKIKRLQTFMETRASSKVRPLLQAILAQWYWHYYSRNRWRFQRRTATAGGAGDDFTTWDLPRLFGHIDGLHQDILGADTFLQQERVDAYAAFLNKGNLPPSYRPTLYDFLAHEALRFYTHGDQAQAKPQDAFAMDADGPVLGDTSAFCAWTPKTSDETSPDLRALRIYQNLARFHERTNHRAALADVEIERVGWARQKSFGATKDDRAIALYATLAKRYADLPLASFALAQQAQIVYEKKDFVRALALCEEGARLHPKSPGASHCNSLASRIRAKNLSLESERTTTRHRAAELQIAYRNITKLHFRVYELPWNHFLRSKEHRSPDGISNKEIWKLVERQKILKSWETDLPPTKDYRERKERIEVPKLDPGFYYIVASWNGQFDKRNNAVQAVGLWVSDLALVTFAREGGFEGLTVHAETGRPIGDVEVVAYEWQWRKGYIERLRTTSNGDGFFSLMTPERKSMLLVASKGRHRTPAPSSIYPRHYGRARASDSVAFFTDRSIYRPPAPPPSPPPLRFKGVAMHVDRQSDRYETLGGRRIHVRFLDPNGRKIEEGTFTTNSFGSFSGSFTTPKGGITGACRLVADDPHGNAMIRVEEYKRPKFEVSLEKPAEGGRLGDRVKLAGKAMSYTGAPIDGAKVKYRVTRKARMPWWWGFYCWWTPPAAKSAQEIAHGVLETDGKGAFEVAFTAAPDRSIDEADDPTFVYAVSVDVTDPSGETRSASASTRLGYSAMEATLSSPSWLEANRPFALRLSTLSLDGKPQEAKGRIRIHALKQPVRPPRGSYFGKPLYRGFGRGRDRAKDPDNWRAWEMGAEVASHSFRSDAKGQATWTLPLKAGAYKAVVTTRDRFGKTVESSLPFLVMAPQAKRFPVKLASHYVARNGTVEVGDTFEALWGTGYARGRAWVEVEHRGRTVESYWTKDGATQARILVPVTEAMRGGFTVHVTQVGENRYHHHSTHVNVPWSNKDLKLRLSSFRSTMEPGAKETWTLEVSGPGAQRIAAEAVATLYDASLDTFAPHNWGTFAGHFRRDSSRLAVGVANMLRRFQSLVSNWQRYVGRQSRTYWSFGSDVTQNLFGYGWGRLGDALRKTKSARTYAPMLSARAPMPQAAAELSMDDDAAPREAEGLAMDKGRNKSIGFSTEERPAPAPPGGGGDGGPDLSKVSVRTNLAETAFFRPHLIFGADGKVEIRFTAPEALSRWKFMAMAHGEGLESGLLREFSVTRKDLMIQPTPPRFLREGDRLVFAAKVMNQSDRDLSVKVRLAVTDAVSDADRSGALGLRERDQRLRIPAGESRSVFWPLKVPDGLAPVRYRVIAASDRLSDGEEGMLPVLPRRILVRESMPLPIRGPAKKNFRFEKLLASAGSKSLKSQLLALQVTSNPSWYAIMALPYLMEYPHECSEQTFNRLYANALARHVVRSDPKIKRVFESWKGTEALDSPLEKNQDLKSVLLEETPWVRQAKNESAARRKVGLLFDENHMVDQLDRAQRKLKDMQLSNGAWPWFPGGRPSDFVTLYVLCGYGRLKHLEVDVDLAPAVKALSYVDGWVRERYDWIMTHAKHPEENHLSSTVALYLYTRSFFVKRHAIGARARTAVDYFMDQARKYWLRQGSRMTQGHLALALNRLGDRSTAVAIMRSIKERSKNEEEMGMYWADLERSWWWYRAPVETQALMIEAFDEVMQDRKAVEDCKVWLLKQKQTQAWKTTKATADAVYALIMRGTDLLASDELVRVKLGDTMVKPEKVEAGTGYYAKRWSAPEIEASMGAIEVIKKDEGVAWASLHWQYFEDMSKITPHATPLKLEKRLFVQRDGKAGPELHPLKKGQTLHPGDLLKIRIVLRTDRDMEFVHMKDMRGSGTEPVNVLSRYRYQDGLAYYESTRDAASHFFIDYLPKGTYVFEYPLRVVHKGRYQTGMAEIRCMYAPEFDAHSESHWLSVR